MGEHPTSRRTPWAAAILVVALACVIAAPAARAAEPPFEVVTPAAADARFDADAEAISHGAPTTTLEWLVQPFYAPTGHMSLRIGKTFYSFGPRGWDVAPASKALLGNRFFQRQVTRNAGRGYDLPSFSYGASMAVPADVAAELEQNILADQALGTKYSLLTNNCQTTLLRLFPRRDGHDLPQAVGVVARLSPRHLVARLRERSPYPVDPTVRLYPVDPAAPGAEDVRPPASMARRSSTPRELVRIAAATPAMFQNEWLRKELKNVIRGAVRLPVGRPERTTR